MKTGIVIFPGINRERDMAITFQRSGAAPRMIWHKQSDLSRLDLIVMLGAEKVPMPIRARRRAA